MALLSRPLRGTVRRTPDDHSDDGAPPTKRQRVQQVQQVQQETGRRRRRSSPDCLDMTTTQANSSASKTRLNLSQVARPRTATRRARRLSNSSADSIASSSHFHTAGNPRVNSNGVAKTPRARTDRDGPSGGAAAVFLRDTRESPDPLDTISPAPANPVAKSRPEAAVSTRDAEGQSASSPVVTRTTRRNDPDVKLEEGLDTEVGSQNASRPAENTRDIEGQQKNQSGVVETEQDTSARTGTERRSLRSTDTGSRSKSELAQYFYNYEQIISLDSPKPVESLAASTTIALIDDLSKPLALPPPNPTPFGNPLQNLYRCEPITLPGSSLRAPAVDPLNDELYFRAHRKFERQEKQLRNIERDRAQHEKQQLERLLEELRGQDWLRVMGLIGVHESEKKLYEPKRQILIQELVALVNKFQTWKDEERRRRLAKDKPLPTADPETEQPAIAAPKRPRKRSRAAEEVEEESSTSPLTETPSTPPDPHDVDALAARQLHQEARSASVAKQQNRKAKPHEDTPKSSKKLESSKDPAKRQKTLLDMKFLSATPAPKPASAPPPPPPPPPPPDKPFTSFFETRELHDQAVAILDGSPRDPAQKPLVLGQPIPEMEERDYEPPGEILTEEVIHSSRRQRRRWKRQSRGG
ncbi:hypothetical protein N7532_010271 [Penicillium argentinense]|uniref:Something about silencing protein 4 domain-containing protein n=1 Tax=Penicillium argentinense TaxID=1131581 RepID=A0A9W9JXW7_9EURO|nr:uncharacterized protein N7532_010271 [Penicillium argentinense]KAJ5085500.1 hypothetical protein N7532_010271 [Penicillium argentinense]